MCVQERDHLPFTPSGTWYSGPYQTLTLAVAEQSNFAFELRPHNVVIQLLFKTLWKYETGLFHIMTALKYYRTPSDAEKRRRKKKTIVKHYIFLKESMAVYIKKFSFKPV